MGRKRFQIMALFMAGSLLFAACGGNAATEEGSTTSNSETDDTNKTATGSDTKEEIVIRMGHTGSDTCMMQKGYEEMKAYMEEKSGGRIQVQIFSGGQLGDDAAHVTAVQNGDLEMIGINNGYMTSYQESMNIFSVPFAFKSQDVAYAVLEGEWGENMLDSLEEGCGLKGLGYIDSFAYRELTTNKPVYAPEDLKGVKIRVMPTEIHLAIWEALGAQPTAIPFSELYTALQQGTVEAQENPFENIVSARLYEVQKYVTLTNHVYTTGVVVANPTWFNNLDDEAKEIVQGAVDACYEFQKEEAAKQEAGYIETITDAGVEVIELSEEQLSVFEKAAKPAVDKITDMVGEELVSSLYDAIEKAEKDLGK